MNIILWDHFEMARKIGRLLEKNEFFVLFPYRN